MELCSLSQFWNSVSSKLFQLIFIHHQQISPYFDQYFVRRSSQKVMFSVTNSFVTKLYQPTCVIEMMNSYPLFFGFLSLFYFPLCLCSYIYIHAFPKHKQSRTFCITSSHLIWKSKTKYFKQVKLLSIPNSLLTIQFQSNT